MGYVEPPLPPVESRSGGRATESATVLEVESRVHSLALNPRGMSPKFLSTQRAYYERVAKFTRLLGYKSLQLA